MLGRASVGELPDAEDVTLTFRQVVADAARSGGARVYIVRACRKPVLPLEDSGVFPMRAETRYLRQYDA